MKKFLVILMVVAMASFLFVGCIPTTNTGPVFTSTPGTTATVGTAYSYTATATDADADTVTFSVAGPTGMAISGAVITWTPTTAQIGTHSVVVTASDGTDATAQTFTITVSAAAVPDVVITTAAILGVTAPVTGATPVTTITGVTQYTGVVTWSSTPTTFAASTAYTATITLTAATGYTLTGVAANLFTVAGATTDTNPADSGVVTAVFPATAAPVVPGTIVSIAAIPGVIAPAYGAAPDTAITATTQYTGVAGAIVWKTAAGVAVGTTFAAETVYVATITLTAETGFTLTGVTANFFTVATAEGATNPADSGVVTATFAKTAAAGTAVVVTGPIAGVTAPVKGATPVTKVTATTQYTGTVTWKTLAGVVPTTFAGGTVYVATITLTALAPYTLTGVIADALVVTGASTHTNPADSGVVTALFTATKTVPTVVTAVFTDSDTITITYSEDVVSDIDDYNATDAINMVYPGAHVLIPNQVDGTGTEFISITFTSADGVWASSTAYGTIVIAATVVADDGGLALVAGTYDIVAGGF